MGIIVDDNVATETGRDWAGWASQAREPAQPCSELGGGEQVACIFLRGLGREKNAGYL